MNAQNFVDVYFGEDAALWTDVRKAPGLKNKFLYLLMPPGWSHTGEHKTAYLVRKAFIEEQTKTAVKKAVAELEQ